MRFEQTIKQNERNEMSASKIKSTKALFKGFVQNTNEMESSDGIVSLLDWITD